MQATDYIAKLEKYLTLRGLSPGTAKAYKVMIQRFIDWCTEHGTNPDDIPYDQLLEYVLYLKSEIRYSPRTVNSNISTLRFFFIYVLQRPLDKTLLPYSKVDVSEPEVLSKAEVAKFINAVPNLKHKAMFSILYSCGLRCGELVNLRYADISRERMTIYIQRSKNRSARYVPLSKTSLNLLTKYWFEYGKPTEWLFPGQKPGTHISKATVGKIIQDTKARLGWEHRRITSHTFRHCCGTHMYEAGYDLPYIQKFLGHRSITSTMVYISVNGNADFVSPLDTISELIDHD